jgi:DNA-nicking Smr family endonuclease
MSSTDHDFSNRPFENLGRLLKKKAPGPVPPATPAKTAKPAHLPGKTVPDEAVSDRRIFLDAVRDVTPISKRHRPFSSRPAGIGKKPPTDSRDTGCHVKLERLVETGEGFVISQTPEYMEGTGHGVPEIVTEQLHQGRFSIQGHIDLHGMDATGATEAIEDFLTRATTEGLRSVLIIHGRGLSSPGDPVLKTRLRTILASNRWRKWILAFSSARSCDGGAGATYVLLRKKPIGKKKMKGKKR